MMINHRHILLLCCMGLPISQVHASDYGLGLAINNSASKTTNPGEIDITLDGYKQGVIFSDDSLSFSAGSSSLYSNSSSGYDSAFAQYTVSGEQWYGSFLSAYSRYYGVDNSTTNRTVSSAYYNGHSLLFSTSLGKEHEYSHGVWSFYGDANYEKNSDYSATDSFSPTTAHAENGANSSFKLAINNTFFFAAASLYLEYGVSFGLPVLGANDDRQDIPGYEPHYRFRLNSYQFEYATLIEAISPQLSFISDLAAQTSNTVLYNSKRFAIGDRHSVRGYGNDFRISGDQGYYWRNTLHYQLSDNYEMYGGVQQGAVSTLIDQQSGGHSLNISGASIGIKKYGNLSYDIFIAAPIAWNNTLDVQQTVQFGFDLRYDI